jgi:hypothetical protein
MSGATLAIPGSTCSLLGASARIDRFARLGQQMPDAIMLLHPGDRRRGR